MYIIQALFNYKHANFHIICLGLDRLRAFFLTKIIFADQEGLKWEMKFATLQKISCFFFRKNRIVFAQAKAFS